MKRLIEDGMTMEGRMRKNEQINGKLTKNLKEKRNKIFQKLQQIFFISGESIKIHN